MKITVIGSKKLPIPGIQYSSAEASVHVEVEVPEDKLVEETARLQDFVHDAVNAEINRLLQQEDPSPVELPKSGVNVPEIVKPPEKALHADPTTKAANIVSAIDNAFDIPALNQLYVDMAGGGVKVADYLKEFGNKAEALRGVGK